MDNFKIEDEDLYALLGIEIGSNKNDIKKAYRKKALQCHPDKNPDNPNAALEFHKLSKVLEILTDDSARAAYDRVLKAKKEAVIRHEQLDGKRKKFKEDLEARERQAASGNKSKTDSQKLQEEIARLRTEGSKQVEEEMEYVLRQVREEKNKPQADTWDSTKHRIKIKWSTSKTDDTNGGYNQELLHQFLSKYGDVVALVMSPKKKGRALVEFSTKRGAEMAIDCEKGLSANPLTLEWVNGAPSSQNTHRSTTIKESDFESVVLTKMRQAEERRKLIEQMMKEDEET